jgi:hypothetical protein
MRICPHEQIQAADKAGFMTAEQGTPLRGDLVETRKSDLMEKFHEAHFRAAVAAAGCTVAKPDPDDGIDFTVTHQSQHHSIGRRARIEVQLRSTQQIKPPLGTSFPFPLDSKTFDILAQPSHLPLLLVVCILPSEIDDWITADPSGYSFRLHHLSYWFHVKPDHRTGATKTTLHIPTVNVFDDLALGSPALSGIGF